MNKTAYDEFFRNYDYYWLKYTMERGMKEKADKLLVGHSLPRFGVNDRDIPGLINLSFFSQDYYYSYRIIERALECIPSIKHVVLGTCYISPFIDLSRAQDRDEMNRIISVYDRYFHDIHNMLPQKYSELKDEEQKRKADEVTGDISGKDLMSLYEARKDNYFCTERDRLSLCEDAWTETVSEEERESYPEWLSNDQYTINELYYGQDYYDFGKHIDILFPMIYAGVYMKKSDWVGELAGTSSAEFPGAVIGLECSEPRTAGNIKGDIEVLSDKNKGGLCFFRYGRIILARQDGEDTLLFNTYPGTAYRMILIRGDEQKSLDCRFEEDSVMTVPGNWDMIRAFGTFSRLGDEPFEGELCTLML